MRQEYETEVVKLRQTIHQTTQSFEARLKELSERLGLAYTHPHKQTRTHQKKRKGLGDHASDNQSYRQCAGKET